MSAESEGQGKLHTTDTATAATAPSASSHSSAAMDDTAAAASEQIAAVAAPSAAASSPPPSGPEASAAPSPVPLQAVVEELGGADPPLLADGSVDDDALIEAALAEVGEEEEEEVGDEEAEEEEEEEEEQPGAASSAAAAGAAAAPAAAEPKFVGETYISESGEVMRRRAPRKKKVVEKDSVDAVQLEADRKAAAERAETLLTNLLKRTNEVMMRTAIGAPIAGTAAVPSKKKRRDEGPRRKSEKEEDMELLEELEEDTLPNGAIQLRAQPSIVTGSMRAYQLEGLNWMIRLYHSGVSGILADEMGLGKTLQSISLLAYLKQYQKLDGPHLVLVPLSTLGNWHREFTRWCPSIRCFRFHGTREERAQMVASGQLHPSQWDVLLTSYEMSIREKAHINKIPFNFIVVDEAHRLKNEGSLLSQIVRIFQSKHRLLLTGTPLQNNLHELWALLNFLLPEIFSSSSDFDSMFSAAQTDADVSNNLLAQLHKVLRPFMLRRLKSQVATDLPPKKEVLVFCGMSELQAKLYRGILEKDLEAVLGKTTQKSRLMNMVMQLRKAANHPYLFEGVEDRSLPQFGEHLINTSGKMTILDKLLARFHAQGSRVLIFSQMTRTLDILEDVCHTRRYPYSRIDGSTSQEDRETSMREFNADNSDKFVFLLSTRAGGLGINLNTADIVILYDSDWNPQMDLQAMDRAHRIGQKKKVFVYRLITESTIEEKIIERAEIKLRLDAMVIQQGRTAPKSTASKGGMSAEEMVAMIRFGADRVFRQQGSTVTNEDIDNILQAAEARTAEMQSKLGKHVGLLDLSLDGAPPMMLQDEAQGDLPVEELERQMLLNLTDSMGKRDRKGKSYDVNQYYRDAMTTKPGEQPVRSNLPKPYRLPRMPDFQFWNVKRISELSDKEKVWYDKHAYDPNAPAIRGGLTAEEDAELQQLLGEGFSEWGQADYSAFVDACKRYGGKSTSLERVIKAMEGRKTRDQVVRYHSAFFEKAPHAAGFKSALLGIARGEARVKKFAEFEDLLERLLQAYPQRSDVMERLPIPYAPLHKGKGFTLSEDRLLLYWCRALGYGEWQSLRAKIRRDAEFRFDYFLKSRTISQLNRRVDTLLRAMNKKQSKRNASAADGVKREGGGDGSAAPLSAPASATKGSRASPSPSPSPAGTGGASSSSRAHVRSSSELLAAASDLHAQQDDVPLSVKRQALRAAGDEGADANGQRWEQFAPPAQPHDATIDAVAAAVLPAATLAVIRQLPLTDDDAPLAQRRAMLLQQRAASFATPPAAAAGASSGTAAPASDISDDDDEDEEMEEE